MTEFKVVEKDGTRENGPFKSMQKAQEKLEHAEEEFGVDCEILEVESNGSEQSIAAREAEVVAEHSGDIETPEETAQGVSGSLDDEPQYGEQETTVSYDEDPIHWLTQKNSELTANIKGTTVITKKGFRLLQHRFDISTGSEVIVGPEENDHSYCRVKAYAEMPDGRRAEAHASASVDRGDDSFLLVSMADTRAKSRALSDVTGCGAVALEEMVGVENE